MLKKSNLSIIGSAIAGGMVTLCLLLLIRGCGSVNSDVRNAADTGRSWAIVHNADFSCGSVVLQPQNKTFDFNNLDDNEKIRSLFVTLNQYTYNCGDIKSSQGSINLVSKDSGTTIDFNFD